MQRTVTAQARHQGYAATVEGRAEVNVYRITGTSTRLVEGLHQDAVGHPFVGTLHRDNANPRISQWVLTTTDHELGDVTTTHPTRADAMGGAARVVVDQRRRQEARMAQAPAN